MEFKKMLVYDQNDCFAAVLRREIKLNIDVISCNTFPAGFDFNSKQGEYAIVLFVCNSIEDLFDFIKIHNKGVPVIVCAFNRELLLEFTKIDDIILLDGCLIKKELLQNIKMYLTTKLFAKVFDDS